MFNFTRALVRHTKSNITLYPLIRISNYSSVSAELKTSNDALSNNTKPNVVKSSNSIVSAAFASLSNDISSQSDIKTPFTDSRIENAKSIDDLLSISNGSGVSRKHALKVVSVLAEWSSNGKVKLADFESDHRFIKLCKVLTKSTGNNKKMGSTVSKGEDLSMIMNVAADDEAAKLIESITLPQMIKVMQTLAYKKRRSTMLLRSLSFNIAKNPQKMDLKQSADLLYSMCILNFPDQNLMGKISNDIIQGFNVHIKKSSVIASIITSLGILKYKDTSGMLDILCTWMLDNHATCRSQDLFALFLTLGTLNYHPRDGDKLFETLLPYMSQQDTQKPSIWLDFVWSLVILNKSKSTQIESVLNEEFISTCESIPSKVKIMHINAATPNNKLPQEHVIFDTPVARTKEKEEMVVSLLDTLKNLMKNDVYIKSNVNTNMGFMIDAECIIDQKCLPVAFDKYSAKSGHLKIAFVVQDYHDMCLGRVEPIGAIVLQQRLLEQLGYTVIPVPYYEYRVRDKLIHRVQFIESKLKTMSSRST